jgi:hypothetical protein
MLWKNLKKKNEYICIINRERALRDCNSKIVRGRQSSDFKIDNKEK